MHFNKTVHVPSNYHPEPYWNDVAKRIATRSSSKEIAGDNEPYYRYKRQQFLKLLHNISFTDKAVLEIGCGPGGNLIEIYNQHPKALHGVDISEAMIALANETVSGKNIRVQKTNGESLPFADDTFDISFTSTVLQHITDEQMLHKTIAEISRVTAGNVYIFERIENRLSGNALCAGRPVAYYETLFSKHRFTLVETTFLNIHASYFVSGAIRKLFNNRRKNEGEPVSATVHLLQNALLPITRIIDPVLKMKRELAMLHFRRNKAVFD